MTSIASKTQINDNSNSIMFGMQHNLRHFHGEVIFTIKKIYILIYKN